MANRRLPMRKIKEVLRLRFECNLSEREIARSCQISRTTVTDYLRRATIAKLSWAEVAALNEVQLVEHLFPVIHPVEKLSTIQRPAPECEYIYNQLRIYRKVNLTLTQLWLEYKEAHPDGYQYSQFCDIYRHWRGKLDYVMRKEHRAGEKVLRLRRTQATTLLRAAYLPMTARRSWDRTVAGRHLRSFERETNARNGLILDADW